MTSDQLQPFLTPIGDLAGAAGYAAAATPDGITTTVSAYLRDPLVLNKLTDRVYELLLEDLRSQRERLGSYGTGR